MRTEAQAIKVVQLSDKIENIVNDRDNMPNGDYQGAIEAVIMQAVECGRGKHDCSCASCMGLPF